MRRPQGRHWVASWSQMSTGAAAHRRLCSKEVSHHREPPWSCSLPRFVLGKDPIDPRPTLFYLKNPASPCPQRAWEQCSGEPPPMAPPRRTYAPPSSTRFDVSHPLIYGGPGLDCRYPFIFIKSESQIKESTAKSDLLCHGLMNRNNGPGPMSMGLWTYSMGFLAKNNLIIK
jgi:hypothetical protein